MIINIDSLIRDLLHSGVYVTKDDNGKLTASNLGSTLLHIQVYRNEGMLLEAFKAAPIKDRYEAIMVLEEAVDTYTILCQRWNELSLREKRVFSAEHAVKLRELETLVTYLERFLVQQPIQHPHGA